MDFQTKMLLGTFAVTVLLGLIIVPILRKLKVGQIERTDGPQSHLKKQGTPTMGGIIIMLGIIIATCCAYVYYKGKDASLAQNLIPILCLTTGFGIIGFIDDYKKLVLKNTEGLKPKLKMLGLLIISIAFVSYLVWGLKIGTETYMPFANKYVTIPIWLYIPFAILVILATTNAINLTDGIALYLKMPLLLLIIAIIPVLETLSVIIQVAVFKKTGKRVFKMAPLHHHFELSGWRENQVVMLFSVITLISCVIGLKII